MSLPTGYQRDDQAEPSAERSPSAPNVAYIALACRDAARSAFFLGEHLGLPEVPVTLPDSAGSAGEAVVGFRVGDTALLVFPQGHGFLSQDGSGVDHIAISTDDPAVACHATGLTVDGLTTEGLNGQLQVALAREATCGVCVRYTTGLKLPPVQRGIVERIDHVGIASGDNALAEDVFCGHVGARYESRQIDMEVATAIESFTSDKYGAIYHTRQPQPVGGLKVSFLTVGDFELEFLQDFDPSQGFEVQHGAAGNTKQDQSAIGRFVTNRGGGLHHIAFKVVDIDQTLGRMSKLGHQMIDMQGRPGSRRARIGFIHPSSTGGVLFHFVQRDENPS